MARRVQSTRFLSVSAQENIAGLAAESAVARRDFLYVATGAFVTVGLLVAAWPFIDQMNPGADVLSAGAPLGVNLSSLQPGQQVVVLWRSRPIFIVRRTLANLTALKSASHRDRLRDPDSHERQQPNYATNQFRSVNPEYLVVVGICTHLGCIPTFSPIPGSVEAGWEGGYLCHCHGSKYDLAGRVFKNVPAPYNLPVPPYSFPTKNHLSIGENPKGNDFDIGSVLQI
jgi:ubiquinol-cytochrome c reductase iron-sulfur subunit